MKLFDIIVTSLLAIIMLSPLVIGIKKKIKNPWYWVAYVLAVLLTYIPVAIFIYVFAAIVECEFFNYCPGRL
jgi:hypothetical protein